MPWPMKRNALSARLAASRRSTRSRRRTFWRLSRYSFSPERKSRRPHSTSPYSTGNSRSSLPMTRLTSAMPVACRRAEPAKMTSSDLRVRSERPCSPSAQRSASARLLLPLPLGPTMALMPGPNSNRVASAKDLKPTRRSSRRRGSSSPRGPAAVGRCRARPQDASGPPLRRRSPPHAGSVPRRCRWRCHRARPRRHSASRDPVPRPAAPDRPAPARSARRPAPADGSSARRSSRPSGARRARDRRSPAANRASPRARRRGRGRRRPIRTRPPGPRGVLVRWLDRRRRRGGATSRARCVAPAPPGHGSTRGPRVAASGGLRPRSGGARRGHRETMRAMTASPRNSRRSFESADASGCSFGVAAVDQRPGEQAQVFDREREALGQPRGLAGRGRLATGQRARRCIRRRRRRCGSSPHPHRRSRSRTLLRGS